MFRKLQFSLRGLMLLLTAVCGYLAAYAALHQPVVVAEEGHLGMVVSGYRESRFKLGGNAANVVFSPIVWLDRAIRPSYWEHVSDFESESASSAQP